MMSRRESIGSIFLGLVLGSGTVSLFHNNKPNSGTPKSNNTGKYLRDVSKNEITIKCKFPRNYPYENLYFSEHTIAKSVYKKYSNRSVIYHNQIKNSLNDKNVNKLVDNLIPDYSSNEVAKITNFVQNIKYSQDWKTTESRNYCRSPIETIIDQVGDCKDKTTLLYSILYNLGYNVGYVIYPNHIAPIINKDQIDIDKNLNIIENTSNYNYTVLESTRNVSIGHTDYNKNNIIYTYTEDEGLDIKNINSIKEQISVSIEKSIEQILN